MTKSLQTAIPTKKTQTGTKVDFIEGLRKLAKDPSYNSQSDEMKTVIRSRIYDRYGEAWFKSKGINPDDTFRRKWINNESWVTVGPDGKTTGGIGPTSGTSFFEQVERFDASLKKGTDKFAQDVYGTEKKLIDAMAGEKPQGLGRAFKNYTDQEIDKRISYYKGREAEADKWFGEHYNDTWKASIVELPGKAVGYGKDLVTMLSAAKVVGVLNGGLIGGMGLTEKLLQAGPKAKIGYEIIKEATTGYLYGKASGESGSKDAAIFGVAGGATVAGGSLVKFLSRLGVAGGTSVLAKSIEAVKTIGAKGVEEASTDKISNVTVKATAKALNETAARMGYKDFWEAQAKGKSGDVVVELGKTMHKAGEQAAVHNPDLVAKEAAKDFKELASNPLGQGLLSVLQKHGIDPIKETVEHVTKATEAASGITTHHKEFEAVGAASAHSFEFEENVSKAIKPGDFVFESREHKLLAAYARLQNSEGKELGFKFRDFKGRYLKQSTFFVRVLDTLKSDPKYAHYSMKELGQIGNRILDHMEAVEKYGGDKRIWRQSEFRPGKPRFGHQIELYKSLGMESGDIVPETREFGVNRVPLAQRASTLIKEREQASLAKKLESRGASKEELEKQSQTVGTAEGAKKDTEYMKQAREKLGPQASLSEVLMYAQKLKQGLIK